MVMKSEKGKKTEVRRQRTEVREQMAESKGQRIEVGSRTGRRPIGRDCAAAKDVKSGKKESGAKQR